MIGFNNLHRILHPESKNETWLEMNVLSRRSPTLGRKDFDTASNVVMMLSMCQNQNFGWGVCFPIHKFQSIRPIGRIHHATNEPNNL